MVGEEEEALPPAHVPDADRAVLSGDGEQGAVRAELDVGLHTGPVLEPPADLPAGAGIPEICAHVARGRKQAAVRGKGDTLQLGVRCKDVEQPAAAGVENAYSGP